MDAGQHAAGRDGDAADSSYTSMRVLSTVVSVVLPLCQLCHSTASYPLEADLVTVALSA